MKCTKCGSDAVMKDGDWLTCLNCGNVMFDTRRPEETAAEISPTKLLEQMEAIGVRKIESPRNVISVAKSPARLVVDGDFTRWAEESGRDDLLTYKAPEPNKTAIKDAIKAGAEIPFAHMEDDGKSLRIR